MVTLKSIRLPASANLKLALIGLAFAIVAATLLYSQGLVADLQASERKTITYYASMLQGAYRSTSPEMLEMALDLSTRIDFPLILAEADSTPKFEARGDTNFFDYVKNITLDTTQPAWIQRERLDEMIESMGETYAPLPVYQFNSPRDSSINTLIFYDDSTIIQQIRMVPVIGMIIISMFILVGYLSFSYIKRSEQSNIWVGMAKETAHQLGTPLSSMLGWIELLRYTPDDRAQVLEAASEMERDVNRLNRIAQRFSKIGSPPELKPIELGAVLQNVHAYFERRLPHLGKKVTLTIDAPEPVWATVNVDLFEWVFENLVRNAADAIDHADGEIRIVLRAMRDVAIIDVIDNGHGIDAKVRKDIFRPGFSTKQRGWGLGLSLAKRIVEDYHGGRIMIRSTGPQGTTFRIRLSAEGNPGVSPRE